MLSAEEYIKNNAETGYKEFKTCAYLKDCMIKLGYKIEEYPQITGFTAIFDSGKQGPTLLIFAELDSLINFNHPDCDKNTGAVHACGHNAQCAALLGVAGTIITKKPNISGRVKFCFVPAEEGVDYTYRTNLIDKGIINYTAGKPEYISRGIFDDCDLAFMVHTYPARLDNKKFYINLGNNGNVKKQITFLGKATHAGDSPHLGINALNAATTAINVINSLRETFIDDEHIRFHSIITQGGQAINTVPDKVVIESYVRGATIDAIKKANDKINNAIKGVAVSFGCNVIIEDVNGAMPVKNNEKMIVHACTALQKIVNKDGYFNSTDWGTICTDFGDISNLMPALHIYSCGMNGPLHGTNTNNGNLEISVIDSAKFQYEYIIELLKDGAKNAKEIIDSYKPSFNRKEYVKYKNIFKKDLLPKIEYHQDGSILIKK